MTCCRVLEQIRSGLTAKIAIGNRTRRGYLRHLQHQMPIPLSFSNGIRMVLWAARWQRRPRVHLNCNGADACAQFAACANPNSRLDVRALTESRQSIAKGQLPCGRRIPRKKFGQASSFVEFSTSRHAPRCCSRVFYLKEGCKRR